MPRDAGIDGKTSRRPSSNIVGGSGSGDNNGEPAAGAASPTASAVVEQPVARPGDVGSAGVWSSGATSGVRGVGFVELQQQSPQQQQASYAHGDARTRAHQASPHNLYQQQQQPSRFQQSPQVSKICCWWYFPHVCKRDLHLHLHASARMVRP